MTRRMSPGRRVVVVVAAVIGVLLWGLAVVGWTAMGRLSGGGGFVDVAIETIQSPSGVAATSKVLVAQVDAAAKASGNTVSAHGQEVLTQAVDSVLTSPELGTYLQAGLAQARDAWITHPADGLTIDMSGLRQPITAALATRSPQLAAQVPTTGDLVITIPPQQMPEGVDTVADLITVMQWVPLALLAGAVVFLIVMLLVTDDRSRAMRRTGIAFIAVGILPLVMRLVLPPVVGGAAGDAGQVAQVATTATIANWWIALLVTVLVGAAMIAAGIWLRQPARQPGGPTVLGR